MGTAGVGSHFDTVLYFTGATGLCLYLLLRKEEDWEGKVQGGVTSRQVAIDVKIPRDMVGIVIGRQGSNIRSGRGCDISCICREFVSREIQAKTETRIHFRDELETEEFRVACIRLVTSIVHIVLPYLTNYAFVEACQMMPRWLRYSSTRPSPSSPGWRP